MIVCRANISYTGNVQFAKLIFHRKSEEKYQNVAQYTTYASIEIRQAGQ